MSRGTLDPALLLSISDTRLSRFLAGLPRPFSYQLQINYAVLTPWINPLVWALSLSLAATQEIDVSFSSSGYLDVSVPRVPSHTLCIHV